jgi:hypothetical protein
MKDTRMTTLQFGRIFKTCRVKNLKSLLRNQQSTTLMQNVITALVSKMERPYSKKNLIKNGWTSTSLKNVAGKRAVKSTQTGSHNRSSTSTSRTTRKI